MLSPFTFSRSRSKCKVQVSSVLHFFRHIPSLCFFIVPSSNSSLGRCIFLCSLFLSIPRLSLSRRFAASPSAVSRYVSFSVPLSLSHVLAELFPLSLFTHLPLTLAIVSLAFDSPCGYRVTKLATACVTATADWLITFYPFRSPIPTSLSK